MNGTQIDAWRAAYDDLNRRLYTAPPRDVRPAGEVAAALAVDNSPRAMRARLEPAKAQAIDAARAAKARAAKAKKTARKKGRR